MGEAGTGGRVRRRSLICRPLTVVCRTVFVYNGVVAANEQEEKMTPIIDRVIEQMEALPYELQWRVFEFTRALVASKPHGVPGRQLVRFAGAIPADDLQLMSQAIEQGCE